MGFQKAFNPLAIVQRIVLSYPTGGKHTCMLFRHQCAMLLVWIIHNQQQFTFNEKVCILIPFIIIMSLLFI
jgi:hypothetical protein